MKRVLFLGVVVCLSLVVQAPAQTLAGLTGTVSDSSGAVVVGAPVTAKNEATSVVYSSKTNASGIYTIPFLPPGNYDLVCELTGFKKAVRTGLSLETGLTTTVDIQLQVGSSGDSVTVSASAELLQSESSTLGQFIERASVENMPLQSRRASSLVRLMGNVVYSGETGAEDVPQFSMAGGRSQNQMWQLDGAVAQNMALGAPQLELNPPAESLQEFRAEVSNYSAEFGRAGSGLILMTTRSGGNQFHGAAYEFFRNDALDARTFFSPSIPPLRYNIFGSSFGGPVKRDKTFFFLNYEGQRQHIGQTVSNTIVPRPAEVNGDFSARKDVSILDPLTKAPFAGNIIPTSRIDPIGSAFAHFYPAPNVADDPTKAPRNNYLSNVTDLSNMDFGTARVDHSFNDTNRMFVRLSDYSAPQVTATVYPNAFADYRGYASSVSHFDVVGTWFHSFRPNLIHETRYSYSLRKFEREASGTGSGQNGKIGLAGVDKSMVAAVSVTGLSAFGSTPQQRIQDPILTHQLIDSLTWFHGKHQIKAGFEWRYSLNTDVFLQTAGGQFTFTDRATNSGLATMLLGWTSSAALVSTDPLSARSDYYGGFVQDDWKVSSRLTLNLGLRWEMDTPRWEENNRQSGFDQRAINPVAGVPGVVTFAGVNGVGKYANGFDSNNFGPRVGFAYRVGQKMVVRGGYGVSYNGEYIGAVVNLQSDGFGLNGSFSSPDGGFTPAFLFKNGMPVITREALTPAYGSVKVGESPRSAPSFFQQNQRNGYAQQWNLTVQKELRGDMVLELAYLGNVGHALAGQAININMIPLVNGKGPAKQDQLLRPFPQFNNVTVQSPPWGDSSYHALTMKVEKRYSNGLNFLANYTWSKFIDNVQAGGEIGGGGGGYTHIALRALDKSLSGNDVPYRLASSAVYELPFGKEKRWKVGNPVLRGIAGDWGVGLIAEFRAGVPYGVSEQTNITNTFSAAQRPNLVKDPVLASGRSRAEYLDQFFDVTAFVNPGTGVFGNAARSVAHGPGFIGVDLSAHKRWALHEKWGLLFRGDFYNLPNRPSFANPNTAQGRADFGHITSILGNSTGRQIQLSLRLEF